MGQFQLEMATETNGIMLFAKPVFLNKQVLNTLIPNIK